MASGVLSTGMRSLWATLVALCVVAAAPAGPRVDDGDARGDRIERPAAVAVVATPAAATTLKLRRRAATSDLGLGLGPIALASGAAAIARPTAFVALPAGAPSRVLARPLVDSRSSRGPPLG